MLNCIIIGCGKIAGGYDNPSDLRVRTHAKAMSLHPNCKLLGIYDSVYNSALQFAKTWNAENIFKNLDELTNQPKIDLVSICTPTQTHEEIFESLINSSVPTIWIEKPAAISLSSALKMKKISEDKKIKVWVNYFRRYCLGLKRVKKVLDSGDIGDFEVVNAFYTKGLRNNGSHLIDLISWYFGDIVDVKSVQKIISGQYPSASFILATKKCAYLNVISLDYEKFELFELDIVGSKGRIQVLEGGRKIRVYQVAQSDNYIGYNNLVLKEEFEGGLENFMQVGLEMGLNGEKMPDLDNEINVQQVISKIEKLSGVKF